MEPLVVPVVELDDEREDEGLLLVHEWCVEQLRRLGLPRAVAEVFAGRVDWHEIANLVERGCPPDLALDIVR